MFDKKVIGGALIIAGTTIGGAILGFPILTGLTGFVPSLVLFALFGLLMGYSAFIVLEVTLRMRQDTNLISMATHSLGRWGALIGWTSYLFLLYSLTTAYIAGGGKMLDSFMEQVLQRSVPDWIAPLPLVAIFGCFVYSGTRGVDRINRVMMGGLIITFFMSIAFLFPDVDPERHSHWDWHYVPMATSMIATAFGFHIVIPSLATYMDHDVKRLRHAIYLGIAAPFVSYVVWEYVTLGAIPLEGDRGSLSAAYARDLPVTVVMRELYYSTFIGSVLRVFEFCAIVTSFLGVSLSLSHFFQDGLSLESTPRGKVITWVLTFIPPLAITLYDPNSFLAALNYAGTFGVLILLAFLPALMAWAGRRKEAESVYLAPGGKAGLSCVMLVSLLLIGLEICRKLGVLGT